MLSHKQNDGNRAFTVLALVCIAVVCFLVEAHTSSAAMRTSRFDAVDPLVPDSWTLPARFRHVAMFHRYDKNWTRGLNIDPRNPLIMNLTDVSVGDVLPVYAPCGMIKHAVEQFGMNGAAEVVATADAHKLGQVMARYSMLRNGDPAQFFGDLITIGLAGMHHRFDSPRLYPFTGLMHGATIMQVGERVNQMAASNKGLPDKPLDIDWDFLLEGVCHLSREDVKYEAANYCMHGIGHAFTYSSFERFFPLANTDAYCFPEPWKELEYAKSIDHGYNLCITAPTDHLRRMCTNGVFHTYYEFSFFKHPKDYNNIESNDVLFPCRTLPRYSANCFTHLFVWLGLGDWRYEGIRQRAAGHNGVVSICLDSDFSDSVQLGCIYGLTAAFFPVFDKLTTARAAADMGTPPSMQRCQYLTGWGADDMNGFDMGMWEGSTWESYQDQSTYQPPHRHCELLFLGSVLPERHIDNTLVGWCSHFIGGAVHVHLTEMGWQRWKTCVAASLLGFVTASLNLVLGGPPREERVRFCNQLLRAPFLNSTLQSESYHFCNQLILTPPKSYLQYGVGIPDGV